MDILRVLSSKLLLMLFLELLDGPLGFDHIDLFAVKEDLAVVHDEHWAVWSRRGLVWQI